LPFTAEISGIDRTAAEPNDISSLHTKDVGIINKGSLNDFIDTYQQPPLSRFFGTIDVTKAKDTPDLRTLSYDLSKNLGFQKVFKFENISSNNPDKQDETLAEALSGISIDTLNIFDAKVLFEALRITYYLVLQEYEKILTVYSEWNNHFTSFWVGERTNQ